MLKILFAGCFSLFSAISQQLILELCAAAQKYEKYLPKKPFFGGWG